MQWTKLTASDLAGLGLEIHHVQGLKEDKAIVADVTKDGVIVLECGTKLYKKYKQELKGMKKKGDKATLKIGGSDNASI